MQRIKKIFFSRFMAAGLCILLEFAEVMAVFVVLYEYSTIMAILSYIFEFGVLLYVMNKDGIAENKLPWIIIILVLPVLGAFFFILFGSSRQLDKEKKQYDKMPEALFPYQHQTSDIENLEEQDMDAFLQANYIYEAAAMPCCSKTKTTYYPNGEVFFPALLDALKAAKHFILMEYFIIEEGVMWNAIHDVLKEKVLQGVTVNVMYDDLGCISTLPQNYYQTLTEEGINCIPSNKFRPILSQIHNNRDHRKITVVDGTVGFTGGINLADEYINAIEKHGYWKDTAVKIEGEAVKNLTMLFLTTWNAQSKTQLNYAAHLNIEVPEFTDSGFVIPFGDSPEPLNYHGVGKHVYLNMINAAKRYFYITTPYLICDYELMNALRLAAQKGVDVRIITPHIPDKKMIFMLTRSNYESLIKAGVSIYEYTPGFIHAKGFVCDDKFAVCGTINLDYRSLVHHFECGAWMYNADCIPDMKLDFEDTMLESEFITAEKAKVKPWQKLIRNMIKGFSPLL